MKLQLQLSTHLFHTSSSSPIIPLLLPHQPFFPPSLERKRTLAEAHGLQFSVHSCTSSLEFEYTSRYLRSCLILAFIPQSIMYLQIEYIGSSACSMFLYRVCLAQFELTRCFQYRLYELRSVINFQYWLWSRYKTAKNKTANPTKRRKHNGDMTKWRTYKTAKLTMFHFVTA